MDSSKYVKLISWLSCYKHGVILNKTQMQKILFICYGLCLAKFDRPLFTDDEPRAWPFGPVFPRTYRSYVEVIPPNLTIAEKEEYLKEINILREISQIVDLCYNISANRLSEWSHLKDSPWYKTVFRDENVQWNRTIDNDVIKDFFNNNWQSGLL